MKKPDDWNAKKKWLQKQFETPVKTVWKGSNKFESTLHDVRIFDLNQHRIDNDDIVGKGKTGEQSIEDLFKRITNHPEGKCISYKPTGSFPPFHQTTRLVKIDPADLHLRNA